jgi:hypothetical protein
VWWRGTAARTQRCIIMPSAGCQFDLQFRQALIKTLNNRSRYVVIAHALQNEPLIKDDVRPSVAHHGLKDGGKRLLNLLAGL